MKLLKLILFVTLFMNCKNDSVHKMTTNYPGQDVSNQKLNNNQNLNVSILLDLSDRISPLKYPNPTMEYYLRDAAYINIIAKEFKQSILRKKIIQIDDKIQLYFAPEPANSKINSYSNQLKFNFNRKNVTKNALENLDKSYSEIPEKIYKLAIDDNKYVGSDTWGFMKNKAKDYCIDQNYRNILVILTDGYIYHKDNKRETDHKTSFLTPQLIRDNNLNNSAWHSKYSEGNYGFIPINQNFKDLEVLVLGINPDPKNDFEEDVITAYWEDWLNSIGVKKFKIYNADLPSNLEKVIKDFI